LKVKLFGKQTELIGSTPDRAEEVIMTRPPRQDADITALLSPLIAVGEGAPSLEEKLRLAQLIRAQSRDAGKQVDTFLIDEINRTRMGLLDARDNQSKLQAMLDELTSPPWHPAIFLGLAPMDTREAAMVMYGNSRRIVTLADDIDPYSLAIGDEVLLADELNVVISRSPYNLFQSGETASFDRYLNDGRMVLKHRDEEVVVDSADALREHEVRPGELVRWNRNALMAFEKVERSSGSELFLEETPNETFDNIGGLDRQIENLQESITISNADAELARRYGVSRKGSVLLVGPPGTGKTMIARALANWLGEISGSGRARFMNIKPGSLHSMWYAQSESNYREAFRVARLAGEQDPEVPVVMFFDEVDAVGSMRGDSLMRVDDRVLTAFMTELDGLAERGNIVVVAATNRRDTLDPALLRPGRLGDLVLEVPRPNMQAARAIFAKHLTPDLMYSHGPSSEDARRQIIAAAVSRIYAPNSDVSLATIKLRDGKQRLISAKDLISGANISKIAQDAGAAAYRRHRTTGEAGIKLEDVLSAMADEFESMARTLSRSNCRSYVMDLPQDVDVVSVDPIRRKVARPHTYLHVA
jgi:proteasome-associated ATPase